MGLMAIDRSVCYRPWPATAATSPYLATHFTNDPLSALLTALYGDQITGSPLKIERKDCLSFDRRKML